MTRKILGLALVAMAVALAAPLGAAAHTTVIAAPGAQSLYQRWIREAKLPTPDIPILVVGEPSPEGIAGLCGEPAYGCEGCFAGECQDDADIALVVNSGEGRRIFFHELGHVYDEAGFLKPWQRERFLEILGQPGRQWKIPGLSRSPNEWFAETYSLCATLPTVSPRASYLIFGEESLMWGRILRRMCWLLGRHRF